MPTVLIFVNLKLTNHLARQNEVYPKLWLKILPLHSFCYCLTLHVTWLHEKQLFLCQEQCMSFYCKEKKYDSVIFIDIWQPSDKPFGQMEQMRGKLASVNGDGMPLNLNEVWSLPGILLFHCLLLFAAIADVAIWFSIWLSSQSDMQTCHQYSFQQDIHTCFPLTGGVCITLMLLIPISQADRPFISLGVSVKTQAWREVQMAQMATSEWNKFGS